MRTAEARRLRRRRSSRSRVGATEDARARAARRAQGLKPVYKRVDTCAAEFESFTPYLYSSYEPTCEANPNGRATRWSSSAAGPNRIGQGIEFDYCCCHAAFALREEGFETVMVNCNPETVSTDYDTADRLYFQPLTFEDVMAVIETERSAGGDVVVPRAVRRADAAQARAGAAGGGRADPRHVARLDRPRRGSQALRGAAVGAATSRSRRAAPRRRARRRARWRRGSAFRSSCGRRTCSAAARMAIVYDIGHARSLHDAAPSTRRPSIRCSIDKFLEDAFEFDVDAVADATGAVVIGGIMEHIEEAGIHSGDSSCVVPPFICPERHLATIRDYTRRIARALKVIGLMNVQYAIKDDVVYVLEVNPRASRTVPYLSKATGVPLAKIAAQGDGRPDARRARPDRGHRGRRRVREEPGVPVRAVPGRGHDSRARDEVHRRGDGRVEQLRRRVREGAARRSGSGCPTSGTAFVSVNNDDKANLLPIARDLAELGFRLIATRGTAAYLRALRPRRRGRVTR